METLADKEIFSSLLEPFRNFARYVRKSKKKLLLISEPNIRGALSLAPIEAALLDSGIPYRRRFTNRSPDSEPFVNVVGDIGKGTASNNGIVISEFIVEGLKGSSGDSRKGPLSTVAQAHFLASEINTSSERLRMMRPWILSGNWIGDSLDRTYDPVYSFLRDHLSEQGVIRVVPVTEVKSPELGIFSWIEGNQLRSSSDAWHSYDLEQRERIMGDLVKPILHSKTPSTTRVEELLWHCIIAPNWDSDLSSQIFIANSFWENKTPLEAANDITDRLVSKGQI